LKRGVAKKGKREVGGGNCGLGGVALENRGGMHCFCKPGLQKRRETEEKSLWRLQEANFAYRERGGGEGGDRGARESSYMR